MTDVPLRAANSNVAESNLRLISPLKDKAHAIQQKSVGAIVPDEKIISWLFKVTRTELPLNQSESSEAFVWHIANSRFDAACSADDWKTVESLSGHSRADYELAGADLPITAPEFRNFRRNHRGIAAGTGGQFHNIPADLPKPLATLYRLYLSQAQADTEAALFVAQASGSTRLPMVIADLLAIGAFASADQSISYFTSVYSVAAAFDTSSLIDAANREAARRLSLPLGHGAHLLTMTPNDISVLAGYIVENGALDAESFVIKARMLAESRQDVNRFAPSSRFRTAVAEDDLPIEEPWVQRIMAAYSRIIPRWAADMPELSGISGGPRRLSA